MLTGCRRSRPRMPGSGAMERALFSAANKAAQAYPAAAAVNPMPNQWIPTITVQSVDMRPILQSNFGLTDCRGVPFVLHRLFLLTRRLLRCVAGLKNLFLPAADACPPSGFTPARDAGSGRRQRRLDATLLEHSDGRRGPPAAAPRAAATPARSTGVRRQPARHPTRPGSRPPARNSRIGRSLGTRSCTGPCENIPGCRTSGPRIDSMPHDQCHL